MPIGASLLVSLMSFVGIVLLVNKISKSFILTALISFAAGSLIGDVFFHLLPESIETYGYSNTTVFGILIGIILMLLVEAYLHCSHDSEEEIEKANDHSTHSHVHLGKLNTLGDALHNYLDGVALASSFLISPEIGIATTVAIILHEIPQEFADVSVLVYAGWSKAKILVMNFLTALTSLLGVFTVYILSSINSELEMYLIPIAIGQFIYIALADLLPVIHKKAGVKKYIIEITTFLIGIGLMYLLTLAEA